MKTTFAGKLRREHTLLRETVLQFVLSYFQEKSYQYRWRIQRLYQGFRKIAFSFCPVSAFPLDLSWPGSSSGNKNQRVDWRRWCFPCWLCFTLLRLKEMGKFWCPLVRRLQFPEALSVMGRTLLSFWFVFVFSKNECYSAAWRKKLRKGEHSSAPKFGASSSAKFSRRIWGIIPAWREGRCPL